MDSREEEASEEGESMSREEDEAGEEGKEEEGEGVGSSILGSDYLRSAGEGVSNRRKKDAGKEAVLIRGSGGKVAVWGEESQGRNELDLPSFLFP